MAFFVGFKKLIGLGCRLVWILLMSPCLWLPLYSGAIILHFVWL